MQKRLQMRLRVLRELDLFYRQMRTRIVYLQEPMQKAVEALAVEDSFSMLFLPHCASLCRDGTAFPDAWKMSVKTWRQGALLSKEQLDSLELLALSVIRQDTAGVGQTLDLYIQRNMEILQIAEEQKEHTGKLYIRVGSAVGLLLGILMV